MRNYILIALATLFIIAGCSKDGMQSNQTLENLPVDSRSGQVIICHKTGNGQYKPITINQNAVADHLAHGDYLPDADGDGYTAIGACTGSMNDCNDNNADVHPGAEEVCGNQIDDNCNGETDEECCTVPFFDEELLNSGAPFAYYFDSAVENCVPWEESVYISSFPPHFYYALAYNYFGTKYVGFAIPTESGPVFYSAYVGVDITEADYACTKELLRAVIAAHPETPNYCDFFGLKNGDGPSAMARPENQLKNLIPENLLKHLKKQ